MKKYIIFLLCPIIFISCSILRKNENKENLIIAHSFSTRFVTVMIIENFRSEEALILTKMFGGDWETFSFVNKSLQKDSIIYKNSFTNTFVTVQEKMHNENKMKRFSITILDDHNIPLNTIPYFVYLNNSLLLKQYKPFFLDSFPTTKNNVFSVYFPYFNIDFQKNNVNSNDSLVLQLKSSKDIYIDNLYYTFENFGIKLNNQGEIDSSATLNLCNRGYSIGNYLKINLSKKELKRFNSLKNTFYN